MFNLTRIRMLAVLLSVIVTVGCVQQRPVPSYAKPGETVVLGLGGIHRNAFSNYHLKPSDLTIKLTDSIHQNFDLKAVHVYKAYPDYNSRLTTQAAMDGFTVGVEPFDGGWFAVVKLLDAHTQNPISASPGNGFITVESDKLLNTNIGGKEGDLRNIPIEILEGTAASDYDFSQQFEVFSSTDNYFVVRPLDLKDVDLIGGATIVVNYVGSVNPEKLMVLPSGHNPYTQISYNVVDRGDGSGIIKAIILNPVGFTSGANRHYNSSLLADLQLNFQPVLSDKAVKFSLDYDESYYVDIDGNIIPTLVPELRSRNSL